MKSLLTTAVLLSVSMVSIHAVGADCSVVSGVSGLNPSAEGLRNKPEIVFDETISQTVDVIEPNWMDVLQERVYAAQTQGLFEAKRDEVKRTFARMLTDAPSLGLPQSQSAAVTEKVLTRLEGIDVSSPDASRWLRVLDGLKRSYVFVDLTDAVQRAWLRDFVKRPEIRGRVRVVATGGDLVSVSRETATRIYFDQGKNLTGKFGVTSVPTLAVLFTESQDKTMNTSLTVKVRLQTFDMTAFEQKNNQTRRDNR